MQNFLKEQPVPKKPEPRFVICNEGCNKKVAFKFAKPKREKQPDGTYENAWYCPHCGHRYFVYLETHAMVALSVKIDKARQRSDERMVRKLQKKYADLFKRVNARFYPTKR